MGLAITGSIAQGRARVASEIGACLQTLESHRRQQDPHRGILIEAVLQRQQAAGLEALRGLARDPAQGVQTIGTGGQGGQGFERQVALA